MSNILERAGSWMAQQIASYLQTPKEQAFQAVKDYYVGNHPAQLKVKPGQGDDNVSMNWIGLAVDRAITMLVGAGVEFEYPEEAEDADLWIDRVWDVNGRNILLHDTALDGALIGTPFIKIVPDGIRDLYTDEVFPRLVLLDPSLMEVETHPMDKSRVERYIMQFGVEMNGKERMFREVTRRTNEGDLETDEARDTWIVEMWEYLNGWKLLNSVEFPYNFPPIHHWKNLPSIHSAYGMSDIEQVLNPQDKYNFVASNNLKINRYHAHPKTWGSGFTKTDKTTSWGADEMITIGAESGKIQNLEMQSDLAASRAIAQDLRQSIFDLSRQVDISSITDKVGQLTNFGLRLLFSDTIAKTDTKRALYGDAFAEINRRLLLVAGKPAVKCEVVFGDPLPSDKVEELNIDKQALDMGIVDKQTVAEKWKKRYGMDWETIQERLQEDKAGESNIGSLLLSRFNQGQ